MAKCFSPHVIERVPTCFEFCETKRMDGLILTFSRISVASAVNRRILLAGGRHRLTNVSRFLFFDSFLSSSIPFWLTSIGIDFIRSFLFVFFCIDFTTDTHMQTHRKKKKGRGILFSTRGRGERIVTLNT